MNSASWSSYRAAMPLECQGEPDDEPPIRLTAPKCFGCGRFFSMKPGSGYRSDDDGWYCGKCAPKVPRPPTPEEEEAARREELAAYEQVWKEELAALEGKCAWCGRDMPPEENSDVCAACVAGVGAYEVEPMAADEMEDLPL